MPAVHNKNPRRNNVQANSSQENDKDNRTSIYSAQQKIIVIIPYRDREKHLMLLIEPLRQHLVRQVFYFVKQNERI